MSAPLRVLVTGAAGQIGYSIVIRIADGTVFGKEQPVELVLLDVPQCSNILEGVVFELQDCALPTLFSVVAVTDEKSAFTGIDYAFLVGAMPRREGMERKDLLAANVKIFKSQGKALAEYAKPTTKVRSEFTVKLSIFPLLSGYRCWKPSQHQCIHCCQVRRRKDPSQELLCHDQIGP